MSDDDAKVNQLRSRTGFDEIAIGCYVSNYKDRYACSRFQNCGCKKLMMCRVLQEIESMKEK